MKRRLTSLLLTAAMVFGLAGPLGGLLPEAGAAYTTRYQDGWFEYILDDSGNAVLTAIWGNEGSDIVIPDTLGGHRVTRISGLSYDNLSAIETIEIPGGIKTIGEGAFDNLPNLKKVTMHSGILEIGARAFEDCEALTEVTLPDTVTSIGKGAFENTGLISVSLPSSITTLESFVFNRCTSLTRVNLPSNLKNVLNNMFSGCSALTDIDIPDGVQSIGSSAFSNTGLVSIDIPDSVTSIGSHAFQGCEQLKSVNLPENITEISDYTFISCTALDSITIPDGVTSIGDYAFENCDNLKTITIPASVTQVGKDTFAFCYNLSDVHFGGNEEDWEELMGFYIEYSNHNPFAEGREDAPTVHYNADQPGRDPDGGTESDGPIQSIPTPVWEEARYTADGVVQLDWTIPLSTVNHDNLMDGVKILRKSGSGGFSVVGTELGDVTFDYTDENVQYGETYTYALQGFYQGQDGTVSEERIVVCLGLEDRYDIPVPELGIIRNDPNGIRIEWELPEDLPAGIEEVSAGFHILRKTEGGEYTRIYTSNDPESNAYLDRTASNGETYTYTVQMFVVDHVGGYDETGRTITRKAVDSNYPNDEIGWSVINSMKYFGHENDYKIPKERFDETLGTSLPQQAYNKLKSGLKAGGYCYGLSVLAAAEYEGLIDLSTHFADAAFTDTLADYGMTAIESGQNGSYHAVIKDQDIIGLIERAHVLQYAEEFRDCEVFAGQKDYHGLIEYLEEDSSKPLLVGLSTASSGHAVVTYPNMPPEDLGDGWYKIYLYDPNVPQIGLNSQLYKYGMNGQLESAYSAGQSYLLLNTNETGVYGGIWQYYNPALGQNANMESLYYYPLQSIMFYDLTKLPAHTLDRTGTVQLRNFMVVRAKSPTVRAADAKGNTTTLFSVTPDSSAQGFSFTANDELVKHYSFDGENQDTILLWLEDDCGDITLQGDDIEAMYIVEDTLFDVTATGKAEITIDSANAAMSYHTDEDAEIELTVQRNSHSEQDAVAATISTDLDAGDNTTLTLQEDGIPKISGPEGQRYDVTIEKENSSSEIPNATVEDLMEFFGEEPLPSFRDVPSDAYYYDAVQWAVEQGITTGTSATRFSPDEPCTRAQVVTFIWRALGLDELDSRSTDNPFRDVPSGAYYRDAVLWAAENGITTGTDANEFSPDEACTRAQVVTFLWRTDFPPKYYESDQVFRDVHVNDYYWFPVQWAVERNITTGTDANEFSPNEACTRAQVVTFLYRDFA